MNPSNFDLSFPARINVNAPLPASVTAVVQQMNEVFLRSGFDDIDFSDGSLHLPHVTLLMGEVASAAHFKELLEKCESFAGRHPAIPYSVGEPFWQKPALKFMFVDTNPLPLFKDFRVAFYNEVRDLIRCEYYGGPENPSHITVGYGDSRRLPLAKVKDAYRSTSGIANAIRICEAGERGTCHNALAEFRLL
jgi:hypothetical protein